MLYIKSLLIYFKYFKALIFFFCKNNVMWWRLPLCVKTAEKAWQRSVSLGKMSDLGHGLLQHAVASLTVHRNTHSNRWFQKNSFDRSRPSVGRAFIVACAIFKKKWMEVSLKKYRLSLLSPLISPFHRANIQDHHYKQPLILEGNGTHNLAILLSCWV